MITSPALLFSRPTYARASAALAASKAAHSPTPTLAAAPPAAALPPPPSPGTTTTTDSVSTLGAPAVIIAASQATLTSFSPPGKAEPAEVTTQTVTETTSHPSTTSAQDEADTEAGAETSTETEIETQAEAELAAANACTAPDTAHLAFEHSVLQALTDELKTTSVDTAEKSIPSIPSFPQVDADPGRGDDDAAAESIPSIPSFPQVNADPGHGDDDAVAESIPSIPSFPQVKADTWGPQLPDKALYGPVGEIVRRLMPNTESDPAAVYMQLLAGIGNLIGGSPYFVADGAQHRANLFVVICGKTAKARKGTSWKHAEHVLEELDESWATRRVKGGMVSGEGVTQVFGDDGDKRLLLLEAEFAQVLQVMKREGNTVSVLLRQAWDGQRLAVLRRKDPIEVEGAHISLIGHITLMELRRLLASVEMSNGMANRCLWVYAQRSKLLSEGGKAANIEDLLQDLRSAVQAARSRGEVRRDAEARERWREIYAELSEPPAGQLGEILSRAEAQVMRIAFLLALLDKDEHICTRHLEAALLLWQYCEASAAHIFAESFASPRTARLWEALAQGPLSRSQVNDLFSGRASKEEIDAMIEELKPKVIIVPRTRHTPLMIRRKE